MQHQNNLPQYWQLLSEAEKQEYLKIQREFSSENPENKKYKSTKVFQDFIDRLKGFVMQGNAYDRNRALVCGIYWFNNSIAINSRQLMVIISKCKSSINGSFQALGYGSVPTGTNSTYALIKLFPHLAKNFSELRQWTIRQLMKKSPPINVNKESISNQNTKVNFVPIPIVNPIQNRTIDQQNTEKSEIDSSQIEKKLSEDPQLEKELYFQTDGDINIVFPNQNEFSFFN